MNYELFVTCLLYLVTYFVTWYVQFHERTLEELYLENYYCIVIAASFVSVRISLPSATIFESVVFPG